MERTIYNSEEDDSSDRRKVVLVGNSRDCESAKTALESRQVPVDVEVVETGEHTAPEPLVVTVLPGFSTLDFGCWLPPKFPHCHDIERRIPREKKGRRR